MSGVDHTEDNDEDADWRFNDRQRLLDEYGPDDEDEEDINWRKYETVWDDIRYYLGWLNPLTWYYTLRMRWRIHCNKARDGDMLDWCWFYSLLEGPVVIRGQWTLDSNKSTYSFNWHISFPKQGYEASNYHFDVAIKDIQKQMKEKENDE